MPPEPEEEFWRRLALEPLPEEHAARFAPEAAATFIAQVAEAAGLPAEDRRFLAGQRPERLFVYRKLMRATLREALESTLPRTIARLGEAFTPSFEWYLQQGGTTSHYLRDVAVEFLDLCAELWAADPKVPPYLVELGRLEATQIEIAAAPDRRALLTDASARPREPAQDLETELSEGDPLALDRGVEFIAACRLLPLRHAVHELPDDLDDRSAPPARPTDLLVYRSPEHEVRFLELSPVAADLVRALTDGARLADALTGACQRRNLPLDEVTLAGAARVLAELGERGVLLGAR
jgi:hypothetical protein